MPGRWPGAGASLAMAIAPRFTASWINAFPSAFAPCKAKNRAPCCTFRESQATWRISRLHAAGGTAICVPWNNSVSFLRMGPFSWADGFNGVLSWLVAASLDCSSSWLNSIFILTPGPLVRLRDFWSCCPELHGDLCSSPDPCSCRRHLIRCKARANQDRLQPQSNAGLCDLAHCFAGKVRHLDLASFVYRHGHRRRLVLVLLPIRCGNPRRRLVGQAGKIRGREISQRGAVCHVTVPVRRLHKSRGHRNISRHIQVWQNLLGDALENRRRHLPAFVMSNW